VTDFPKRYLGDGAYVAFDGYSLILTAEDGIRATNTIVLEPSVYAELVRFVADLKSDTTPPNAEEERTP
jgi:hypothetical protein